jgi:hypothetical protein
MKILKKLNKKIIIYLLISVTALLLIISGLNLKNDFDHTNGQIKILEEKPTWNIYTNTDYGFEIAYPSDWELNENFKDVSPTINIYLSNSEIKPPFDQFAKINNVSIFPKGLQTEAVIGQSRESNLEINFGYESAIDYILKDETIWATYINPKGLEEPWKSWGFIWSRNVIENVEYGCISSGVEISLDSCNPFEGDEFTRIGNVDPEIREIQEEIIKSFNIIEK